MGETASGAAPYVFERGATHVVVQLNPELNDVQWGEIEALGRRVLTELEGYRVPMVIVDLSPLSYMGSAMVALIVRLWKTVKAGGGKMSVVCPDPMVHKVLALAGLDKVWPIVDSRDQAQQQLGVRAAVAADAPSQAPPAFQVAGSSAPPPAYLLAPPAPPPILAVLGLIAGVVGLVGVTLLLAGGSIPRGTSLAIALTGSGLGLLFGGLSLAFEQSRFKGLSIAAVVASLVLGIAAVGLGKADLFGASAPAGIAEETSAESADSATPPAGDAATAPPNADPE